MSDRFDFADLKRRVEAARELTVPVGGRTFTLRYPDRNERRRLAFVTALPDGRIDQVAYSRDLVAASVVWWDCTVSDAFPESKTPDEPLPLTPEAIAFVLGERADWVDELFVAIIKHYQARDAALETDRKNSPTASPGNDPSEGAVNSKPSDSAP